jgi:GNAT superfamily N-acetyltransferase
MSSYRVRPATPDDAEVLVRHRIAMFSDMGTSIDAPAVGRAFRAWLLPSLRSGTYRAWLAVSDDEGIVGGGGLTVIPWPPGPWWPGERVAFVYNVYTDPAHRRRGLARLVMDAIHAWCRAEGIRAVALNASRDARSLYESMGYAETPSPMMWKTS